MDIPNFDLCSTCHTAHKANPAGPPLTFEEVGTMTVTGPMLAAFEAAESEPAARSEEEMEQEEPEAAPTEDTERDDEMGVSSGPAGGNGKVSKAEKLAAKLAAKAEKMAAKVVKVAEKEAAKAAKDAQKLAAKVAAKAAKEADREAARAAKLAEREAAEATEKEAGLVAKAALDLLLCHPAEAVRLAATEAVQQAQAARFTQGGAETEASIEEDDRMVDQPLVEFSAQEKDEQSSEEEPRKEGEQEECKDKEPEPVPKLAVWPSARVINSARLVTGIEAEEDEAARGDVTSEFEGFLKHVGAKQVFRMGRVKLETGEDETGTVPAEAKIVVINDGEVPWPETTSVELAQGESFGFPNLQLGALAPNEAAEIVFDLTLPVRSEPCSARSTWAVVDRTTLAQLGPVLFFEAEWVKP